MLEIKSNKTYRVYFFPIVCDGEVTDQSLGLINPIIHNQRGLFGLVGKYERDNIITCSPFVSSSPVKTKPTDS